MSTSIPSVEDRPPRSAPRRLTVVMIAAALALIAAAVAARAVADNRGAGAAGTAATTGVPTVAVPTEPTDGVLTIVIPPGMDAAIQRGESNYHMPSVMRVRVGDTIVIRNDDVQPHLILYTFLMPGQTHHRTFTAPGSEVYSGGCSANAAEFHDFTTIFVGDR